jgi:hypothetical protein
VNAISGQLTKQTFSSKIININVTVLGIIHRSVSYLRLDVSDARFFLCLHVEPTQLDQIGLVCVSVAVGVRRQIMNIY